ncbi:structural protein [Flavobacterium phage FLiP]|uniref:Structural protein n=1 Tax=Flavobacterium phage FLiP TaxID=2023716 RepID=A0A222NP81_9VIRU|nr:structural protein [Flavobacterium phage FLiP]ASQ41217.1 structural protein [Flavobacterium phage FLiP]
MKILDKFAVNFQRGGIPFLIFIAVGAFALYKIVKSIIPKEQSPEEMAHEEIQESVSNQVGVKDKITTQDKIIANRIYELCNTFWTKFNSAEMLKCAEYFTSATVTKRVFSAYGVREISHLWFSGDKKNLVETIQGGQWGVDSPVRVKFDKIFKNANLG